MSKVLIIRLSAIGDVAMVIPVCCSLAVRYPDDEFVILSKKRLAPLFAHMPANVSFKAYDDAGKHAGFGGLLSMYGELRKEKFDMVADLHNVLRSAVLRTLFFFSGKKMAFIHKGKKAKDALVNNEGDKDFVQLKHSIERYRDVFRRLGFEFDMTFTSIFPNDVDLSPILPFVGSKQGKWIGIAPFAKHKGKIYPLEQMEEIVQQLSRDENNTLFLFGGGEKEKELLAGWEQKYPRVKSMVGVLQMDTELLLMSQLDVMLAMDSANMHLASLVGTTVVSIWGATHPYAGFYGYNQDMDNAVQIDFACRPCSVFGDKPCFRNDYACLTQITPKMVIDKIEQVLQKKSNG